MFTIEQIKSAHARVKSGADFPRYIADLIQLGVASYNTYVVDGHTEFTGTGSDTINTEPKYDQLLIAEKGDKDGLLSALAIHQAGGSDYMTFCRQAADAGVEKWVVDMDAMTCSYYDKASNLLIAEEIPAYGV